MYTRRCTRRSVTTPRNPRIFAAAFERRMSCLGCLYALLADTSAHAANMFSMLFLGRGGSRGWVRDDILFRKHRCLTPLYTRSVGCRVCAHASPHYIFIPVSRAFAGYLRQIVRLSGFAVPIFSKEVLSPRLRLARSLARSLDHRRETENSLARCTLHYRLQNKSRNRYRRLRELCDSNSRRCNDAKLTAEQRRIYVPPGKLLPVQV